jgi:hypothetical protein
MGHAWRTHFLPQQDALQEASGSPYSVLVETPPEGYDYLIRLPAGLVVPVMANEVLVQLYSTGRR